MIFTKPLTEQHGTGLLLIAMGIILKMLPENNNKPIKRVTASTSSVNIAKNSHSEELRVLPRVAGENEENKPLV